MWKIWWGTEICMILKCLPTDCLLCYKWGKRNNQKLHSGTIGQHCDLVIGWSCKWQRHMDIARLYSGWGIASVNHKETLNRQKMRNVVLKAQDRMVLYPQKCQCHKRQRLRENSRLWEAEEDNPCTPCACTGSRAVGSCCKGVVMELECVWD